MGKKEVGKEKKKKKKKIKIKKKKKQRKKGLEKPFWLVIKQKQKTRNILFYLINLSLAALLNENA